MNLAPALAKRVTALGVDAIHWTSVGAPTATDAELFAWAQSHDRVIVTHDLDFPALLASTKEKKPSTIVIRTNRLLGEELAKLIVDVVGAHGEALAQGAIVTLDAQRMRVRLLPL